MYFHSLALCVTYLLPLLFLSSNARPDPSAPSPTQPNITTLSSIGVSSKAVSSVSATVSSTPIHANSTQVPSVSATVSSTPIHASSTQSITISSNSSFSNTVTGTVSTSTLTASLTSSGNISSSTQPASSPPAPTDGSGIWTYRNSLFGNTTFVQTGIPPSVVNHGGQLFVMYTDRSSNNLYYAIGNNDNWGAPTPFVDASGQTYPISNTQAPALAEFYGDLHAVIQQNSSLIHFIFNDTTSIWNRQSVITSSYANPTLTTYNGFLFLAVMGSGNRLSYCFWDPNAGWSGIAGANGETTWGIPAMYVQENLLYMLFAANNGDRGILNLVYNTTAGSWSRVQTTPESTAYGVSATFGNGLSFMAFQDHRSTGNIFVNVNNGSWAPHETPGEASSDTPTMAVLDNFLNVVFNSHNGNRDILWLQRSLTNYSLDSWMSVLSDSRPVSSLSIPGTHDSAAVSHVPTVGCQTMSITDQLGSGIRYFDLRAGLWNNIPIMYHGVYPIDPPLFLPLATVIENILQFLSAHNSEAVMVQIKEDASPTFSNISFARAISQVVNQSTENWNIGTTVPTLGALRGKIQLLRRYSVNVTAGEQPIGIDITSWPDNNPRFDIYTPSGAHFVVQDEYAFDEDLDTLVPDKFGVVDALMEEANSNPDPATWYLNLASATHPFDPSGFWIMPEDIALGAWDLVNFVFVPGVNSRLRNKLYGLATGERYGTILMDYPEGPDGDLIARIVACNM